MSTSAGHLHVGLTGDASSFKAAMEDAKKSVTGLRGAIAGAGGLEERMDELKKKFGGRSFFKDVFEFGALGGAIAGIGFAVSQVTNFAKAVNELNAEYRRGNIDSADYWSQFADNLPVLGQFKQMWDEIGVRGWFGLETKADAQAQLDALADTLKENEELFKRNEKLIEDHKNKRAAILDQIMADQKVWADAMLQAEKDAADKAETIRQADRNREIADARARANAAQEAIDAARKRKDDAASLENERLNERLSLAGSIFEQMRNAPQLGGSIEVGSAAAISMANRAVAGVSRASESDMMRKAVETAVQQLAEQKRIADAIETTNYLLENP